MPETVSGSASGTDVDRPGDVATAVSRLMAAAAAARESDYSGLGHSIEQAASALTALPADAARSFAAALLGR